jgi:hypothetical protein
LGVRRERRALVRQIGIGIGDGAADLFDINAKVHMNAEITRRLMLGGLGALASTTALAKSKFAQPVSAAGVSVDLVFADGSTLAFSQADATDLGDYRGQFVHQRCLMQRRDAWTVFFRPDADGKRDEVVIEYGVWPVPAGVTPGHILNPYRARIRRGGQILAEITAPKHFWMTRWRWPFAPRRVVRTFADLVAMKAHLPMSERALYNNPPNYKLAAATWTGPLGTAGILPAMPAAADRQEIGPITDLQGSYLLRRNPEALAGMMAQAEASGSFPIWVRDTRTNNLLDVFANPYQSLGASADQGEYPRIYPPPPRGENGKVLPDFFITNVAHFPDVVFIPWMLTDDPYYLEGAQAQAIYAVIEHNGVQLNQKLPGTTIATAKRAMAWGLRGILRMAAFAPENPPPWLQPRSYFRHMADDSLVYIQRSMAAPIKTIKIFHNISGGNFAIDSWMEGYFLSIMGWARWTGFFPKWHAAIDWLAETLLQITSDPALGGWDRRWPAPYEIPIPNARKIPLGTYKRAVNIPIFTADPDIEAATPDSWGELWKLFVKWHMLQGKPLPIGPEDKIYQLNSFHYHEVVRGALAALTLGGVPGAKERHDWIYNHLRNDVFGAIKKSSSFRYAYWPG